MNKKLLSVCGCLAAACAAAGSPLLSEFARGTAVESARVRLEARTDAVAGAVVVGSVAMPSPDGASLKEWDASSVANGWHEVSDGGAKASLLVLNPPDYAVEGGRLAADTSWTAETVHWVRNWVVVPNGVTLTVKEGAIVKFGEETGIKVENGGTVDFRGTDVGRIVLTHFADDSEGGDSDFGKTNVFYGCWSVIAPSGGAVKDAYTHVRYGRVEMLPTLSMPDYVIAQRVEGRVLIPVTVSGTRSDRLSLHWRVIEETAKCGTDFMMSEGEAEWADASASKVYFEIPLVRDVTGDEVRTFRVEVVSVEDANPDPQRLETTVAIVSGAAMPVPVCASSDSSEAVRLEARSTNMLGRAAVVGSEWKADDGGSRAELWDTTPLGYGWQALSDGHGTNARVLAFNDERIAVEGGRLAGDATWASNVVHVVRNTVVVPSGVTLAVVTNTVVKFCENTGIRVESGGRLELQGSLEENVYLTLANDDTVGGDTDREADRAWAKSAPAYAVTVVSGGTFVDRNAAFRGAPVELFGYASTSARIVVDAAEGKVRIPVFVTGSRSTPFSVDWKTSDGNTGQLVWNSAAEGTKWAVLDVADCSERFSFELCECRGVNIDGSAKSSEVSVYRSSAPFPVCTESAPSEAVRCEARAATTFGGALCCGAEWKSADADSPAVAWDTTREADDWVDLGNDMKLLVRNDAGLVVEGGRLMTSVAWTKDVVHVVRNWVVVPSGVTLTIEAGTVVKFAEHTGFKVESGGRINVSGAVAAPVVYTSAADDTIGGDIDRLEREPQYGDYAIEVVPGGTYADSNCAIRYATFSNLGTATLPASAVAGERSGAVRVPVFIGTSRTAAFCVDWRVASGTYATSGRLSWNAYTEGTKYIEIPLAPGTVEGAFDEFEIEMYESQGINVSTESRKCTVRVYPDDLLRDAAFADSAASEAVRLEARDVTCDFGAQVVTGTELKSQTGEDAAESWNTALIPDGWTEVSDGAETLRLLVRNDPTVAIEGGRLEGSATWTVGVTHVVRNWVVVPRGRTLTVRAGTVVKFCENTGIKIEAGGRLDCVGSSAADVVFTSINDDSVGGDTDLAAAEPAHGNYRVDVVAGGVFTDVCAQMRYGEGGTFGTASVVERVVAKKDGGVARIPVFIESSRTTPFAVDWVAHDGTAAFGEDYLSASGRVTWASASTGTAFLEIPLNALSPLGEVRRFTVELITGLGVNLNLDRTSCEIVLYDTRETFAGGDRGYAASDWSACVSVDTRVASGWMPFLGEEHVSYCSLWNGGDDPVEVLDVDPLGKTNVLQSVTAPCEGTFAWLPDGLEEGRHLLSCGTNKMLFVLNRDIAVHGGMLMADETWGPDKVHLVRGTVTVPSGVSLAISPNAIVKFMPGAGIAVADGGLGVCKGTVFTHAYDDTIGGDVFFDGDATRPSDGDYALTGDWEYDETTQYRYEAPREISGTLASDLHCFGFLTYLVSSDVTVPSGVRLTIDAGATLKFAAGRSLTIASGGVLDASAGSRALPIVFTSASADPQPGDWRRIVVGGRAAFSNCRILYASNASGNDVAGECDAMTVVGGNVTFVDSTILHGGKYAVGVESGHFCMTNSVVADCYCAFRHWAYDEAVNCVFYGCDRLSNNEGQKFRNCIFSGITEAWSSGANVYDYCMAWNPEGHGIQDPPRGFAAGTGNQWGDPLFEDPEAFDFRLSGESPCVDAGAGSEAPVRDYYGQLRQNVATVVPKGTPDADGCYPDIGIHEVQPRFVKADVDLAVESVSVPDAMEVGDSVEISWRVTNLGSADANGPWSDKVEIVSEGGETVLLGTSLSRGGLVAGGSRQFVSTFRVPSLPEGKCRVRVTANCSRDLYEGSLTANNVRYAASCPFVTLPTFGLGTGSLSIATASASSFRLEGSMSTVRVQGSVGMVSLSAVITDLDSGTISRVDGVRAGDCLVLSVPLSVGDRREVVVSVVNESAEPLVLPVDVGEDAVEVLSYSPTCIGQHANAAVQVVGMGLDRVASVTLSNGAGEAPVAIRRATANGLTISVAADTCLAGSYDMNLVLTDGHVVRGGVLEVFADGVGPRFTATLDLPTATRSGRVYTGRIRYSNDGDEDMNAPCLTVRAENATMGLSCDERGMTKTELDFYAVGTEYPSGVLKAGETGVIEFYLLSGKSPTFSLLMVNDDSQAWVEHSEAAVAAATQLNANGRVTTDAHVIDAYAEQLGAGRTRPSICGVTIDATGKAVQGVAVRAYGPDEAVRAMDVSDENGRFELGELEALSGYRVCVVGGGSADSISVTTPSEGDVQGIALTVRPPLAVYVSLKNVPEGGSVRVDAVQSNGTQLATCEFDASDMACLELPAGLDGIVCFKATTRSGYEVVSETSATALMQAPSVSLSFRTERCMCGRTTDVHGNAVSNALVRAWNERGTCRSAWSGADGAYVLNALDAGDWRCEAIKTGYDCQVRDVRMSGSAPCVNDLTLVPNMSLCSVSVVFRTIAESGIVSLVSTGFSSRVTAGNGMCRFSDVPSGTYTVRLEDFDGKGLSQKKDVLLELAEQEVVLDERIVKCTVCGRLTDVRGNGIAGSLSFVDRRGSVQYADSEESNGFRIELEPDDYRLSAFADGFAEAQCALSLESDISLALRLEDAHVLTVLIGEPLDRDLDVYAVNGSAGRFLGVLPAGENALNATLQRGDFRLVGVLEGEANCESPGLVTIDEDGPDEVALVPCSRQIALNVDDAAGQLSETAWIAVEYPGCEALNRRMFLDSNDGLRLVGCPRLPVCLSVWQSGDVCRGAVAMTSDEDSACLEIGELSETTAELLTDRAVTVDFVDEDSRSRSSFAGCLSGRRAFPQIPECFSYVWIHSRDGVSVTFKRVDFETGHLLDVRLASSVRIELKMGAARLPCALAVIGITDENGNRQEVLSDVGGAVDLKLSNGRYCVDVALETHVIQKFEINVEKAGESFELQISDSLSFEVADAAFVSMLSARKPFSLASVSDDTASNFDYSECWIPENGINPDLVVIGYWKYYEKYLKDRPAPAYPECTYNMNIWYDYLAARKRLYEKIVVYSAQNDRYRRDLEAWQGEALCRLGGWLPYVGDLMAVYDFIMAIAKDDYKNMPLKTKCFVNSILESYNDYGNCMKKLGEIDKILSEMSDADINSPRKSDLLRRKAMLEARVNDSLRTIERKLSELRLLKGGADLLGKILKRVNFVLLVSDIYWALTTVPNVEDYGLTDLKSGYLKDLDEAALAFMNAYNKQYHRHVGDFEKDEIEKRRIATPESVDPNEMAGPGGKGRSQCVRDGDWMNYTIYFENKSDATGAAQDVDVTLPKDGELDWTTFELGEIAYGRNVDTGLVGKPQGSSLFSLPGSSWSVLTVVSQTPESVVWHLRVVDPSTPDNYPADAYAGFLPPNDSTGRGEGYLRYKVKVRNGATAGKIIGASAIIVFDDNPAIETDPAWSNTVSRLVSVSGKAGAGATIMVDPNWIKTNLGEEATDAQVAEALNKTGKNGIKVWANAALGLDPNDENDKFLVDAPQNDDSDTVTVKTLKGELPESAWTPIKYRVDVDKDGAGTSTPGTAQDANEFGIDVGGDTDPTGVYKLLAVFTDDEGAEIEEVPAANQIGILRKAAANKREIVPVPWTKFAAGAEDIAVSNLVKTAGLTAGDKLYAYDDSTKLYATWELQSDKTWKPVKTVKMVNGKLVVQTADSPEVATVKRGAGVWLERQDTSKPIALVGQYEAAPAVTEIDVGTSELPMWNLIASPAISNWNLNTICEGVGAKDRIIVPTGKEPRIYTRDAGNTKWGYTAYEANAKGIVKPVRKEDDTLIAPGTGLWYISEGGAPVIKW